MPGGPRLVADDVRDRLVRAVLPVTHEGVSPFHPGSGGAALWRLTGERGVAARVAFAAERPVDDRRRERGDEVDDDGVGRPPMALTRRAKRSA